MTNEQLAIDISKLIGSLNFAAVVADIPVIYDGDPATPPTQKDYWIHVHIMDGEGRQVSTLSGNETRFRDVGVVQLTILGPTGHGTNTHRRLADVATTGLRNATTTNNVRFRTPSKQNIGKQGSAWVFVVSAPYYVDTLA